MTTAWILYVLLVGSLVAIAALAIDGILRRTTLSTRWLWLGALVAIAGFAVIAPSAARPTATQGEAAVTIATVTPSAMPAAAPGLVARVSAALDAVRATTTPPRSSNCGPRGFGTESAENHAETSIAASPARYRNASK